MWQPDHSGKILSRITGAVHSQWAAICSIAPKIGCTPETLRVWIRQQEPVGDEQDVLTASERQRLKELEREMSTPRFMREPRTAPQ